MQVRLRFKTPDFPYPLGTDNYGRDIWSRAGPRRAAVAGDRLLRGAGHGHRRHADRRALGLLQATRRPADAPDGRVDGLSGDPARHRDCSGARALRAQRRDCAFRRLHAAHGAHRALHRAGGPRDGLRAGGQGVRGPRSVDRMAAHPAQQHGAAPRPVDLHLRLRDPRGGDPELPRRRAPAADADLGQHDRRGQGLPARSAPHLPLSRHRGGNDLPRPQPARRRPARRPRPPPASAVG